MLLIFDNFPVKLFSHYLYFNSVLLLAELIYEKSLDKKFFKSFVFNHNFPLNFEFVHNFLVEFLNKISATWHSKNFLLNVS